MAAGSGQRIAHASQHASDSALQHINIYDPEAGAKEIQQRQAGTCLARAGFAAAGTEVIPGSGPVTALDANVTATSAANPHVMSQDIEDTPLPG
jgi:hypothetical protein